MKPSTLETKESFSFRRPTGVYKEMYTMNGRAHARTRGLGMFSSLVLSFIIVTLLGWALVAVESAFAADPKPTIRDAEGYSARYVWQSETDPITIEAGESKLVRVRFKNTGATAWDNTGSRYISAYTMEPRYRDSVFFGSGWESKRQIGRMAGIIQPGDVGELGVYLHAPDTVGEYTEEFYLAAENYSWMKGGYFYLKINVVPPTAKPEVTPAPEEETSAEEVVEKEEGATSPTVKAKRTFLSKKAFSAKGGERIAVVVTYQNLGETPWTSFRWGAPAQSALASANNVLFSFADTSWEGSRSIVSGEVSVPQYKFLKQTMYLRAPAKKGEYTASLALTINGEEQETLEIPITVTSNAPSSYTPPVFDDEPVEETAPNELEIARLSEEPIIRVGLWKPEGDVHFISQQDSYDVYQGTHRIGVLPKGERATIGYFNRFYVLSSDSLNIKTKSYIRLVPQNDPHAVFELENYDRPVTWKGPRNFNEYRGGMEYRKGEFSDDLWVVNELLFHDYAKGIGENANGSPLEYLKSQSVAQVSYAYAIKHSDKHGIFDVVATTGDQLYLGYGSEVLMPNFVKAVDAVRGYMVTYKGEVVITPYYAHSDGYTRGWHQVWGGSLKPWLVSVKAHYDTGSRMFGHGVGMSQIDASQRAKKEGLNWRELLQYYYTDTEAQKMYE